MCEWCSIQFGITNFSFFFLIYFIFCCLVCLAMTPHYGFQAYWDQGPSECSFCKNLNLYLKNKCWITVRLAHICELPMATKVVRYSYRWFKYTRTAMYLCMSSCLCKIPIKIPYLKCKILHMSLKDFYFRSLLSHFPLVPKWLNC